MSARKTTAPRPATIPTSSDRAHRIAGARVRVAGAARSAVKTILEFPQTWWFAWREEVHLVADRPAVSSANFAQAG